MEKQEGLDFFFKAITDDARIGPVHICLYCALLSMSESEQGTVRFMRKDIMQAAKLSGKATFNKCIYDLHEFGYICYRPSRNHRKKSCVNLNIYPGEGFPSGISKFKRSVK